MTQPGHSLSAPAASGADVAASGALTADLPLPAARPWWRRAVSRRVEADPFADEVAANAWVPIALVSLIICAFLFRFAAADQLSSHVDEAASVLAAEMVAEKGVPVFPSGTLYLQGATISYLLAPLIRWDVGGYDHLFPLRLLSVIAGTLAVYAAYRLGRAAAGSAVAGFVLATFVALDPVSVRWSGMVRMYALLQLLSLVLLWLFLRRLLRPRPRRELIALVAVFWVGVYTHVGICLFLPGMVLAALLIHGRDLQDRRRDLSVALAGCAVAPATMMLLNRLFSPPNEATSGSLPGVSFVGDFLFSFEQVTHPSFHSWELLFSYSWYGQILPWLILAASALLAGRYFLGDAGSSPLAAQRRRVVGTLFLLYWLPITTVALLATEPAERYLLHIHPVGLALVVILAYDLVAHPFPRLLPAEGAMADPDGLFPADAAQPWRRRKLVAPRGVALDLPLTGAAREARARELPAWLSNRLLAIAAFAGVTLIALFVRITNLNRLSLWLDEGFTALYSRQEWSDVAGFRGFYSPHPPLYFTLVKASDQLFADEYAGRLISVIAGVLTIPVFFWLIAKALDRRAAFMASLTLALSPIHLYYSQEARMYALVVFLVALTYLALVSYHHQPHWGWAALYGVAAAAALWVDYSSVYALAPQALFILVQFSRHRRAAAPLFGAGVLAVLAYAPWVPQVLDSIDAANLVERRESYLGVDAARASTAILGIIGFAGDGSYFQSERATIWNRSPNARFLLILALLPVVVFGARALWRRWAALAVVAGLLGTVLVGTWISLISPGFAERTVLATVLGWAALVGAAFSRASTARMSGLAKTAAVGSAGVLLLAQVSTIDVLYNGAVKQRWEEATADVSLVQPLNYPLVTYSYGAVADTLIDIYHPDLLDRMRVITVRDGELEEVLSNGVIPEVGLTRTHDIPAGRLMDALPQTPENDLIWYLYYFREGEADIRAAIQRAGYTRLLHNHYAAPRYQVFLDLYARPGANLGTAVPIDASFAEPSWVVPPENAAVAPGEDGAAELTLSNQSLLIREVSAVVEATGPSLMTFGVDLRSALPNDDVEVVIACLSAAGAELTLQTAEIPQPSVSAPVWNRVQVTALCPEGTASVRLALQNRGYGDASFRNPTLQVLPIPTE